MCFWQKQHCCCQCRPAAEMSGHCSCTASLTCSICSSANLLAASVGVSGKLYSFCSRRSTSDLFSSRKRMATFLWACAADGRRAGRPLRRPRQAAADADLFASIIVSTTENQRFGSNVLHVACSCWEDCLLFCTKCRSHVDGRECIIDAYKHRFCGPQAFWR